MKDNEPSSGSLRISRRSILKSIAGVAAAGALQRPFAGMAQPASINPKWYGFNLLEYFSTDADWMNHFPYRNDGQFQEDDFRWMRDWGFNWVRLPMDYRFWTDPADPLVIREKDVEPIDRAIRLGEKYNVHVNICLHRAPGECILDGMDAALTGIHVTGEKASLYTDQATLEAFVHQWVYFAERYKSVSSRQLSFNLVNEPLERGSTPQGGIKDYARVARAAIEAIRARDSERLIVSDGYQGGTEPVPELFGTKVLQCCHDYSPFELTHYRIPWARPMSDQVPLPTWPLKDSNGKVIADKQTKRAAMSPWSELAGHGVPLHFGEMGCGHHTPPAVAYAWFNETLDLMGELHSGWALWNLRGPFGILDTGRTGTKFENWHGHQLDTTLLNLLKTKMKA